MRSPCLPVFVVNNHEKLFGVESPDAAKQHYLLIGPWDHGGTTHPRREVSGLAFGPASLVDVPALIREWFDFTMAGGPRPAFLQKRVTYYVAGAEEWRYADSLDEIAKPVHKLYLTSDGAAGDVFHSGRLTPVAPAANAAADHWTYDPLDTRPEELDRETLDDSLRPASATPSISMAPASSSTASRSRSQRRSSARRDSRCGSPWTSRTPTSRPRSI